MFRRCALALVALSTAVGCQCLVAIDPAKRPCGEGGACGAGHVCVDGYCQPGQPSTSDAGPCSAACTATQVCLGGGCFETDCGNVDCGSNQACVDGGCVDQACVGAPCDAGSICSGGQCLPTNCLGVLCPPGQACIVGSCVDVACAGVICPAGTDCSGGRCFAGCDGGQPCVPGASPCHAGVVSCVTGAPTCWDLGLRLVDGAACGPGNSCFDAGCVPCALGAACQPPVECSRGNIACGTGAPVCSYAGNKLDGTACDGGACHSGACAACNSGTGCSTADVCTVGTLDCSSGAPVCAGQAPLTDGTPCLDAGYACASGACRAPRSCKRLQALVPDAGSGVYLVDLQQNGTLTQAWCDMVTADGGWTILPTGNYGSAVIPDNAGLPRCGKGRTASCWTALRGTGTGPAYAGQYYVFGDTSVARLKTNFSWQNNLATHVETRNTSATDTYCVSGNQLCLYGQHADGGGCYIPEGGGSCACTGVNQCLDTIPGP